MTRSQKNQTHRKAGRGIRPFLLIPKVLAMALYFGSIASSAILWYVWIGCHDTKTLQIPILLTQVQTLRLLIVFIAVPALVMTLAMGLLLLLQHPKTFFKLRWLQVKLTLLMTGIPVFHAFMASRLHHFREALESGTISAPLQAQLSLGFALLLTWSILIIWLGRHKPRLWQNWAKSFASLKK